MNDLHRKTWDWITHDLCGMLLGGNTVWGRVSIVGLVLLCAMVGASHAQQRAIAYPLVDRSHAMAVHRRVEQWVVDVKIDTSEQPIFASGAVGLKVTLRWDGRRIGEGQWTGPLDQKSVDLIFVAQLAANRAIGQVQRRHEQNKGKSDATLQSITAKLQVDVQIARQVKPIILAANAARDEIYSTFSPGYHGLVMTTPSKSQSERHGFGRRMRWRAICPARCN